MLPGRLDMPGQLSADIGVGADMQQAHQCQTHKGLRMDLVHALRQTLMLKFLNDDDSCRDSRHIAIVCLGWHDMGGPMEMPLSHGEYQVSGLSASMDSCHRPKETVLTF